MPPFLMPMDRSAAEFCQRTETGLEGKAISCFVVGGERRLCLPQILNTCLGRFTLAQIYGACDTLQINCAPCNAAQLGALKRDGILPSSASCCGLITLSDAQRLCNALLRGTGTGNALPVPPRELFERYRGIPVMHRCFGRCSGTMFPGVAVVRSSIAAIVVCNECRQSFSVEDFVCHSHGHQETRTCHWGFEVANWRFYLQLVPGLPDEERLQDQLDAVKAGQCGRVSPPPRKRLEPGRAPTIKGSAPDDPGSYSDSSR
jgi:Ski-like protein